MDISQVLLRALLSGMEQRNRTEGANWKVGSIVNGLVLEMLLKDTYAVNVEGKKLTLQSPFPLSPGEEIRLEVQGHDEGQVKARLLPPESRDAAADRAANLLKQAGIDDTPQNRMILKSLTASMLGLTRENFQQAARGMALLGKVDEQAAQTAAFALKTGTPMNAETLRMVQSAFAGTPLQGLQEWIHDAKKAMQVQGGAVPDALLQLEAELAQALPESDDPAEALAQKLARLLESQLPASGRDGRGDSLSGAAKALPSTETTNAAAMSPSGEPLDSVGKGQEKPVRLFVSDLSTGKEGAAASEESGDEGGNVKGRVLNGAEEMTEAGSKERSVKSALERFPIDRMTTEKAAAERPAIEKPVTDKATTEKKATVKAPEEGAAQGTTEGTAKDRGASLTQQISRAIREVESFFTNRGADIADSADLLARGGAIEERLAGHQVLQGLDKGTQGANDYLSFSIPYRLAGGKEGNGQLRVYKDGKNRTLDPENVRMALVLDTENLGFVTIELAVLRKEVQSRVTVAEPAVMEAGKSAWPDLQQAMAEQGFHLGGANWRVGAPVDLRPAPNDGNQVREPGRLNIRI
ncbi:hypothetical protein GTO89_10745 [Heliobacterium gestii]|uniref:Flagellar hook-length control protein-like C-terminal domain-containing protein n=1 Tax=Heliomicrobium gestii TaxID=2699 RepID=A0A845L9V3_HELGE|nr:flagellar hook-length control protein FliK [Heliomicrobium gestii]MBM7867068.1 hypothetical protein [Heliomicrobium gestii]MZP43517.1 hypothetical protein [Heliomicrobium gestii]